MTPDTIVWLPVSAVLLSIAAGVVVVPGAVDYTDEADAAYARFAETGAHVVRSTDPVESWPGPLGG